jgi:hypothetical protein
MNRLDRRKYKDEIRNQKRADKENHRIKNRKSWYGRGKSIRCGKPLDVKKQLRRPKAKGKCLRIGPSKHR